MPPISRPILLLLLLPRSSKTTDEIKLEEQNAISAPLTYPLRVSVVITVVRLTLPMTDNMWFWGSSVDSACKLHVALRTTAGGADDVLHYWRVAKSTIIEILTCRVKTFVRWSTLSALVLFDLNCCYIILHRCHSPLCEFKCWLCCTYICRFIILYNQRTTVIKVNKLRLYTTSTTRF